MTEVTTPFTKILEAIYLQAAQEGLEKAKLNVASLRCNVSTWKPVTKSAADRVADGGRIRCIRRYQGSVEMRVSGRHCLGRHAGDGV